MASMSDRILETSIGISRHLRKSTEDTKTQRHGERNSYLLFCVFVSPCPCATSRATSLPKLFSPTPARLFHFAVRFGPPHSVQHRHAKGPLLHPFLGEDSLFRLGEDLFDFVEVDHARAARADGEF